MDSAGRKVVVCDNGTGVSLPVTEGWEEHDLRFSTSNVATVIRTFRIFTFHVWSGGRWFVREPKWTTSKWKISWSVMKVRESDLCHRWSLTSLLLSSSKSSTNAGDQLSSGEWHREQLGRHEAYLSIFIRNEKDESRHNQCENLAHRSPAQSSEESSEDVRSDARRISIPRMYTRLSSDLDLIRARHPHRCSGRHRRRCDPHLSCHRWILSAEFDCPSEYCRQRYHTIFDSSVAASRSTCRSLVRTSTRLCF